MAAEPNRVMAWLAEAINCHPEELTHEAELESHFGVTGVDAVMLMDGFAKEFRVDMEGFDIFRHFQPEGFSLPWLLTGRPTGMKDYGKYPITAGHLVQVAQLGKWFLPAAVA